MSPTPFCFDFFFSPEDVERCKQKDLLAEMLAEMTGDFPTLYKVFVSERDQYLARSLRLSATPIEIHNPDGGNYLTQQQVIVCFSYTLLASSFKCHIMSCFVKRQYIHTQDILICVIKKVRKNISAHV